MGEWDAVALRENFLEILVCDKPNSQESFYEKEEKKA